MSDCQSPCSGMTIYIGVADYDEIEVGAQGQSCDVCLRQMQVWDVNGTKG